MHSTSKGEAHLHVHNLKEGARALTPYRRGQPVPFGSMDAQATLSKSEEMYDHDPLLNTSSKFDDLTAGSGVDAHQETEIREGDAYDDVRGERHGDPATDHEETEESSRTCGSHGHDHDGHHEHGEEAEESHHDTHGTHGEHDGDHEAHEHENQHGHDHDEQGNHEGNEGMKHDDHHHSEGASHHDAHNRATGPGDQN